MFAVVETANAFDDLGPDRVERAAKARAVSVVRFYRPGNIIRTDVMAAAEVREQTDERFDLPGGKSIVAYQRNADRAGIPALGVCSNEIFGASELDLAILTPLPAMGNAVGHDIVVADTTPAPFSVPPVNVGDVAV